MMKALTHNIQQEREDQRDRSAQLFMWCIVVSMHQDDGIGASRLLRACNEMDAFEKKYQTAILYGSRKNATDAMRENLKGICDFEVRLPVDRAPRGRREEQLRMASNQGAEIAWLVMAATCHETFGYGKDRLARLKQNSMNNYKQYLEWEKEDKDLALDRLRRCVQDALKEDLRVTDTDDRKGMLSTPGRGPSVYETAAVYSEIFRRARAGRAVAPLAVYSAAKYDETMAAPPDEFKAKIIENCSRLASKGYSKPLSKEHLDGINKLLDTNFTQEDMEYIYTYLGNGIKHELCMKFVQSGYDLSVIEENV